MEPHDVFHTNSPRFGDWGENVALCFRSVDRSLALQRQQKAKCLGVSNGAAWKVPKQRHRKKKWTSGAQQWEHTWTAKAVADVNISSRPF